MSTVKRNSLLVLTLCWIVTVILLVVVVKNPRYLVIALCPSQVCMLLLAMYTAFVGQFKFGDFDQDEQLVWTKNIEIGETFESLSLIRLTGL